MKNLSIALNAILLVLVIILFVMVHNLKKGLGVDTGNSGNGSSVGQNKVLRVAHINLDTINADYKVLKDFQKEIEEEQAKIQDEYTAKGKKFQDEYQNYMQKKQSGNISQIDDEKTQQDLAAKQDELKELQQQGEEVLKDAQDKKLILQKKVQNYVAEYNKKAKFDYILYNSNLDGLVVVANDSLDITKPILSGLNQIYNDSIQKAASGAKH